MAYSEYLADRIKKHLPGAVIKKMMGGLIFMVNDKMCVGIDVDKHTQQDRLMVRVGKLAYEDLLSRPGAREMDFTGKPMKGFIFIYPEGFDDETDLEFWIEKALLYNKQL